MSVPTRQSDTRRPRASAWVFDLRPLLIVLVSIAVALLLDERLYPPSMMEPSVHWEPLLVLACGLFAAGFVETAVVLPRRNLLAASSPVVGSLFGVSFIVRAGIWRALAVGAALPAAWLAGWGLGLIVFRRRRARA